jgi:hypothetical protein
MDIGLVDLGIAARPDRADDRALGDRVALLRSDRTEMGQRHAVTVRGEDRQRPAVGRDGAREGDHARRGRAHVRPRRAGDIDPAMLAGRVRVGGRREGSDDGSVARPGPGARGRREQQCGEERRGQQSSHRTPQLLSVMATRSTIARRCPIGQRVGRRCYKDVR